MKLPQKLSLDMMSTSWAAAIDPVLSLAPNQGLLLKNIALDTGVNVINHKLGKVMQGWVLIDQDAAASIYRSAPLNKLTLTVTASAPVTISIWVF